MVLLAALFHGWVAFASVVSSSHDPVGWPGQAAAVLAGDHGHSHDLPADDHDPGQHSTHDAADHSHDKPNLPTERFSGTPGVARVWGPVNAIAVPAGPFFSFDRPPRTVLSL